MIAILIKTITEIIALSCLWFLVSFFVISQFFNEIKIYEKATSGTTILTSATIPTDEREKFLQIILSKTKFAPSKLKGNSDALIDRYEKINDLEEFKKAIIETLLLDKNFSIQGILELLYNNSYEQCINKEQKLVDYILKNYKNSCKEISIYKPPLNCGEWEIEVWDYCGREECIILKTIIKAAKEENFALVDFLIRPQTVNILKEYIAYNPNNLWKEFLKDNATYSYNRNEKVSKEFKKWSNDHKIRKKQEIIKLLIKYNYIKNVEEFICEIDNCYGNDVLKQRYYKFMSPLHAACRMNNEKILNLLLQHMKKDSSMLNINSLDGDGQPSIYYASKSNVSLVNMLIDAGARYDLHLLVNTALSNEIINRLEDFNFFNNLTKLDQKAFVQQQLYFLASKNLFRHNYSFIENILNSFVSHGVDFNKKYEQGQSLEEIVFQRYKLDIENQEKEKKNNIHYRNYEINHTGLYTLFAFSRKTNVINYGLLYLSLKESIQEDILKTIMGFYYFLTFDIEKEIYRSYAQKYTPQDIDQKFQKNKSHNFAKQLHGEINSKINEKYKEMRLLQQPLMISLK